MSLIDKASGKSFRRGIDYFERKQVTSCEKVSDKEYNGLVLGGQKNPYFVHIDLNHPLKSECNCKFAEGRRVICKHMVALYFTVYPEEAQSYIHERDEEIKEYEERQLREENRRDKRYKEIYNSLEDYSKEELQARLANYILEDEESNRYNYDEYNEDIYDRYY